jgi:RimJ/RimL family protein N-acetyltransferase
VKAIELTTERLLLDVPTRLDVSQITAACQDPVFEKFMTLPWPYATSDAEYFVDTLVPEGWASGTEATWALRLRTSPDRLVGVVGIRAATPDVGYWMVPEYRGNGYMTEALERTITWAIETEFVGASSIKWSCIAGNTASAAVARNAGFKYTGAGPSPIAMRDGSHPDSWLGEYVGSRDSGQWPSTTFPVFVGH